MKNLLVSLFDQRPGATSGLGTPQIMWCVCAALTPGLAVASYFHGSGYLTNLAAILPAAWLLDFACARLRRKPFQPGDGSAAVTAMILALALPPSAPWPLLLTATAGAIGLARQLYGGLGHNLFNPAMVGYAIVLISWPLEMSQHDSLTGATALTEFKYRGETALESLFQHNPAFGRIGDAAWEWINLAYAAGGLLLWASGLIAAPVVAGYLLGVALPAFVLAPDQGLALVGFHLFSGGILLAAFFVVTDPVTHPETRLGQWIFGLLAGVITFVIRVWGAYPDGIAFAVLIANGATPLIDHLCRRKSRTSGQ